MRKILTGLISLTLLAACNDKSAESAKSNTDTTSTMAATTAEVKPAEIADPKYMESGKHFLAAFSKGDIDGWLSDWQDNGVFLWNNLDSVVGKAAVAKYWKDRWSKLDSITFMNDIWLPVQVNKPQRNEQTGVWLLGWYAFNEKFKNGKRVVEEAHDLLHFGSDGKIDRQIHFVDMAPIKAAMMK
jgi:ketosteroid isomerase-like protein